MKNWEKTSVMIRKTAGKPGKNWKIYSANKAATKVRECANQKQEMNLKYGNRN
jgi:hypothetical protein